MDEAERIRQLKILIAEQAKDDKSRKVPRERFGGTTISSRKIDQMRFREESIDNQGDIKREYPEPINQ